MNSDCPMGAFCVDGGCRNDIECINDDDCPGEQTCISLTCTPVQRDCYDMDLDGFFRGAECGDEARTDCDDNDPSIHPGAIENIEENCGDGIDNDCDGVDVPCRMNNDMDGDGVSIEQGDCDDTDPFVNPNQFEMAYDGKDNDCDPATPDCDVDGDGYGRLTPMGQVQCRVSTQMTWMKCCPSRIVTTQILPSIQVRLTCRVTALMKIATAWIAFPANHIGSERICHRF